MFRKAFLRGLLPTPPRISSVPQNQFYSHNCPWLNINLLCVFYPIPLHPQTLTLHPLIKPQERIPLHHCTPKTNPKRESDSLHPSSGIFDLATSPTQPPHTLPQSSPFGFLPFGLLPLWSHTSSTSTTQFFSRAWTTQSSSLLPPFSGLLLRNTTNAPASSPSNVLKFIINFRNVVGLF